MEIVALHGGDSLFHFLVILSYDVHFSADVDGWNQAGDAFWDVEGGIAAWLTAAPSSKPTTTFMKISQ